MTDNDRGKKKGKKASAKDKKSSSNSPPRENQSSSSSSTVQQSTPKLPKNQQKVQILRRPEPDPARPPALMNQSVAPPIGLKAGGAFSAPSTNRPNQAETSLDARHAEENRKQKEAYYLSDQAGTAASINACKTRNQYTLTDFPLDRNENILVQNSYNLHITATNTRCNGLYIRVKSQGNDDFSTGALVHIDASEDEIRQACIETMKNLTIGKKSSFDRCPFSESSEDYLSKCQIKRLDERQETFPEAIYYCDKCDYHISTISHAKAHLESSTHFDDIERGIQREALLKGMPEPTKAHLTAITKVLHDALAEYKEERKVSEDRKDKILFYLNTQLFKSINCEEVTPRLFGSWTYDVMLPDSDLNVAYTTELPQGTPIFAFLEKVRKQIADDGFPANHSIDMGTSSTIIFTMEDTRVRLCWFSCFGYRSQLYFSTLMQTYISLRPEVVEFLQLIRLWATKAGVDSKNKPRIGLPRYGFDILAIHFLQQADMLPVLHELYFDESSDNSEDKGTKVEVEVKKEVPEESEKPEEPKETKEQKQLEPTNSPRKNEEAASQSRSVILPEEARQRRMRLMSKYQKDIGKIRRHFDLEKDWNMAKLWLDFFRYYVGHHRDVVVQITQKEPMNKETNRWNKKILHVVDPFRGDNVLSIPKVSTWQPFYFNCLLTTFISFSIPRTVDGPLAEIELYQSKGPNTRKKVKESLNTQRKFPETPKQLNQITEEEQYNLAADELAEDQEAYQYMQQLKERLQFDGIPLRRLKPEDVEIDDHFNQIYSKRTFRRIQRVLPRRLTDDELKNVICPGILNKRTQKRLTKLRKQQRQQQQLEESETAVETVEEVEKEVDEISEQVRVCVVIAEPAEAESERREPTPPVETSWMHWSPAINKSSSPPPLNYGSSSGAKDAKDQEEEKKKEVQKKEEEGKTPVKRECRETVRVVAQGGCSSSATFARVAVIDRREFRICTEDFFIRRDKFQRKELARQAKSLAATDYKYDFSSELFCGEYEMEMKCTHCDGSHCVETCPMMEIPPIEKFAPRSDEELKDIDEIIDVYYKKNILAPGRLKILEDKVKELEKHLQTTYEHNVTLTIFGSVMTGLSVGCSDIDICLRFGDGHEPPADRTPKEVILQVEAALRKCKQAKKVQAITTAKVPIVKFYIKLDNDETVDVDVSYYNILALYNTKLLKEYTLWTPDNRFAKLALFIKNWAKSCDIGDASRGSLSSYAHTVLLISFLQQCDPPVLPRLQEDFRSENQERRIVENWDTSFVEAEHRLLQNWTKNKDTCAQLLLGYLDYYSRFDFRNFVVQCRREMVLSKVEKEWIKPLCVEDPFDLNHNLSSGVTKKMFVFVMKVFIASRAAFMSLKPGVPRDSSFLANYKNELFRKCHQGSAPSDRQCHLCHRIGHFYESCPMRTQTRDTRRRYGSNSTTSSYRSNGVGGGQRGEADRITYHKRPYNRRSNK